MRNGILFLSTLIAALASLAPTSFAQLADRVNTIDGFELEAAEDAYFNAVQCETPADTGYEIVLSTVAGEPTGDVYLWAGKENGNCQTNENRLNTSENCREIEGNPRTIQPNSLITDLTLQELLNTGVVSCDSSGLSGTPYEVFAFRDADPGSDNIPETDYGISAIKVDVEPPAQLNMTNDDSLLGEQFVLTWSNVTDEIEFYRFYRNDTDDPATATLLENITADQNASSKSISASELNLALGDTTYLFVAAVDKAFQTAATGSGTAGAIGNEGPLSTGTQVSFVETAGFCDATGTCSGCSASPMALMGGDANVLLGFLGLVLAVVFRRRLRW